MDFRTAMSKQKRYAFVLILSLKYPRVKHFRFLKHCNLQTSHVTEKPVFGQTGLLSYREQLES